MKKAVNKTEVSRLVGKTIAQKAKKVKEIDDAIKNVEKDIKKITNKKDAYRKTLESKKQALKQIKKQKFKKKDIGTKEAKEFLKGFSKGKK